jgi:hypothetical protein
MFKLVLKNSAAEIPQRIPNNCDPNARELMTPRGYLLDLGNPQIAKKSIGGLINFLMKSS